MQLRKENSCREIPPPAKVEENEKITEEVVTTTLRRAPGFFNSIQGNDGHWPFECAGLLFPIPALVRNLIIAYGLTAVIMCIN